MSIHFWTPHDWPSTTIHVDRVVPRLRAEAAARSLLWRVSNGPDLPREPTDWLVCLKAVPPPEGPWAETVLMLNDDADRVWGRLARFDHVVVVSAPVLASLVGTQHQSVWFIEEPESDDAISLGGAAIDRLPPSGRAPTLLWHGLRESLDSLPPLREALDAFAQETGSRLELVTNRPAATERWGSMSVEYVPWSPDVLATRASQARLGIIPARPTLADSFLKSAGRVRCLFALGCPAMGDARSPDVVDFGARCGVPAAAAPSDWLSGMRRLWQQPILLDEAVRCGHTRVRREYSASRSARQWLSFFCVAPRRSSKGERCLDQR